MDIMGRKEPRRCKRSLILRYCFVVTNLIRRLQAIVDRFSLSLRRLATSDHIVKTAGVAGYAQSVLVPELAVRLVMEDMDVSDDAARQILRESMQLGQKLNPAADDVVPVPVDSGDELKGLLV